MKEAALFDVDRTLVRINTGNLYMWWRYRQGEAGLRDVLRIGRWMLQYTIGIVDAPKVTKLALEALVGVEESTFRNECRRWYHDVARAYVTQCARAEVLRQQQLGRVCAILTASTPYLSQPLAEDLNIEHVLCTKLSVKDGRFTGNYLEPLCYGPGKVKVAESWAEQHHIDLERSAFFTDSISDLPMLKRVGEPRVVNADPRLRWLARRQGWRIERWQS